MALFVLGYRCSTTEGTPCWASLFVTVELADRNAAWFARGEGHDRVILRSEAIEGSPHTKSFCPPLLGGGIKGGGKIARFGRRTFLF